MVLYMNTVKGSFCYVEPLVLIGKKIKKIKLEACSSKHFFAELPTVLCFLKWEHMQNPGNQIGVVYHLTKGVMYSYEAQHLDVL